MPIVVQTGSGGVPGAGCFPTAAQIISSVATDLLQRIAPEDPNLLDYINRIQLQLLRVSRWKFLLSPPQRFVTQLDRTDYYIGPTGGAPLDTIDTGLNIPNIGPIKTETFFDRSNYRLLKRTDEIPLLSQFTFRDSSGRSGVPRLWRNAPDTPNIVNIYPPADNQNNYQPQPEAPALSTVVGGALPARIYFVRTTFIDSLGNESSASDEGRIFVPAGSLLVVQPPLEVPTAASGINYDQFNVYIANGGNNTQLTTANETIANQTGPLSNSAVYLEPATGFTPNGTSFPTDNNVESLGGYLIEFRYFQAKPQVTSVAQQLLIPCDYNDILIAGVNYYAARLLKDTEAMQEWQAEFEAGKVGMIRDKNLFPRSPDFIHPDPASVHQFTIGGIETFDESQTNILP